MINTLILSSSRADFGIYLPLIRKMKGDAAFSVKILAFGTHVSQQHGNTISQINESGLVADYVLDNMCKGDKPADIAGTYGNTVNMFAEFWANQGSQFDLVFVLGDRFEMAAAVASGIPFRIPFAHIHGGETTLGAIDNIYRHSISLASRFHFTSLKAYTARLEQILGTNSNIYTVGALGLDNLEEIQLLQPEAFKSIWGIDLTLPFILVTTHPETIRFEMNKTFAEELFAALRHLALSVRIVAGMPNADTGGSAFRTVLNNLKNEMPDRVHLIENFGTQSYFTCMKYAGLLLGNTSSGIIEAASFGKYVINIGDRQKGRISGSNVIHLPFDGRKMADTAMEYFGKKFEGDNIYKSESGSVSNHICSIIKQHADFASL